MVAQPLRFSVDSITIGDMEDIEDITGKSFDDILTLITSRSDADTIGIPVKVLKALVFVMRRHDDENFTVADAAKVRVSELQVLLAEPDPPVPAG